MTTALSKARIFEADFTEMMLAIAVMADKHSLPMPTVVFPIEWEAPIRTMPISNTADFNPRAVDQVKFVGVPMEYGKLVREGVKVLRYGG